ncbi:MAG: zinc ribbon domain-containing protein [Nitrospirae bacterium]|jgi:putative FmdB family regulatory protein|nr:zinc ribbon domain-containing protein [Nitrospirota bacterium]
MPIYEFRCLQCGHIFEILNLKKESEKVEMKCPKCGHKKVERALSRIGVIKSRSGGPTRTVRECGDSTCTTIEVPGPKR